MNRLTTTSLPVSNPTTFEETPPSAARIAEAIANFPYPATVAVMDIIDNAVEAGAGGVSVVFEEVDRTLRSIAIVDTGSGVAPFILNEVLRAGSVTDHLYSAQSLSRFGIGLKGAGFALARRITILTQFEDQPVERRCIDRDHIRETNQWMQETRKPTSEETDLFVELLSQAPGKVNGGTGTVVLLEKVNLQMRDITKLKSDLVRAIGETYGRFLGMVGNVAKLHVRVDDVDVEPIDPLRRENPSTIPLIKREEVVMDDNSSVFLTSVSLPHPNSVSDEIRRRYRYTQKDQGIYVYRNGRLVMGGQTLGLFGKDFHLNGFRAEIEYTTSADHHIRVDVAKSSVILSEDAASKLKQSITSAARTADTLWREKDVLTKEDIQGLFDESNRLIASREKLLVDAIKAKKGTLPPKKKSPVVQNPKAPKKDAEVTQFGGAYIRPVASLPEDVLYRPVLDGNLGGLVVEVNLSHPFSKAVFEVSPGEGKKSVPRRATTAIQQLLYVLAYCEDSLSDDKEQREMFEQFRRYLAMNLRALLAD